MRFTGWQEEIVERLVKSGVVESKAEALRLALFKLAVDYGLIDSVTLLGVLQKERRVKGREPTMQQVLEGIGRAKQETIRR